MGPVALIRFRDCIQGTPSTHPCLIYLLLWALFHGTKYHAHFNLFQGNLRIGWDVSFLLFEVVADVSLHLWKVKVATSFKSKERSLSYLGTSQNWALNYCNPICMGAVSSSAVGGAVITLPHTPWWKYLAKKKLYFPFAFIPLLPSLMIQPCNKVIIFSHISVV